LQKFSAEKLREEDFAWVPKGSIQAHKDDAQVSGATKAKERRRFEKQLPSWKFAPDHQSHWSWHQPCSMFMLMWNSSHGMNGYPSSHYFDPWYGFLCHGGLPNYYVHH
jgi:hypothetical protein